MGAIIAASLRMWSNVFDNTMIQNISYPRQPRDSKGRGCSFGRNPVRTEVKRRDWKGESRNVAFHDFS